MKKPTLTQIKKDVLANGGTYRKLNMYLNGQDCWEVNGKTLTKGQMIEQYMMGDL